MGEKQIDTVLVVDDTEANLDILVEILGDTYSVRVAMDGESATKIATEDAPDLILLDIIMPDMDGYEVCRRLKANPKTEKIPIIFVTVKDEPLDEALGFNVGCVDYITKPINPAIVSARVKNHIELSKARIDLELRAKELIEAAKLKEEVDNIARHDLKNPLSAIFGGTDLLPIQGTLNNKQMNTVEIIKKAALRLLTMINSSLDLFKMEQGIYKIVPEKVDIIKIINRIEAELESLLQSKNSSIVLINRYKNLLEKTQRFFVWGEDLLCYIMLANLIKNAVEASHKNEPVTITLSGSEHNRRIRIHNSGEVPGNIKSKFFNKFVTEGKKAGTGLGTYSAKLIARTMQGDISMKSNLEDGTTITVFLPLLDY